MHDQILVGRVTRPGASALKQLGLRMDESQGNKLSESASILLNVAEQKQMSHPMFRKLGMAVHHRGRRGDAEAMRRPNHFDPLPHFQLVGTQRPADLIVENFRCRSWTA